MKNLFKIILLVLPFYCNAQNPHFVYTTTKYHSEVENYTVDDKRTITWELTDKYLISTSSFGIVKMKLKKIETITGGYKIRVKYKGVKSNFIVKIKDNEARIEHLCTNKENRNTYQYKYTN